MAPIPGWHTAWIDDPGQRTVVVDVASGMEGFVASGTTSQGLRLWLSEDGVDWQPVPPGGVEGVDPGLEPRALAAGDARFVLLGSDQRNAPISMTAWTSKDGLNWAVVESAAFQADTDVAAADIVWSGDTFVAVGTQSKPTLIAPDAFVAVSSDGLEWTRIRSDAFVSGDGLTMRAAAAESGTVYAFGSSASGQAAVLRSRDGGMNWSRQAMPALDGAVVFAAVSTGSALLVGGCARVDDASPTQATVWTMDLGLLEVPRALQLEETPEQSCVNAVDATPRGLLAAGFVGDLPALWESSDGDAWTRVAMPVKPALYGTIRGLTHDEFVAVAAGDGSTTSPADVILPPTGAIIWIEAVHR